MGLKNLKVTDEAYAQVAKVASIHKTYLCDAADLIIFGKVDNEGKRIESGNKGGSPKRTGASKKRAGKAGKSTSRTRKLVEGLEDVTED